MRRVTCLLLCAALLAFPVLALGSCRMSPGAGIRATSCCETSCSCGEACGGSASASGSSLSRCVDDHATAAGDFNGTLVNPATEWRFAPVVQLAAVHPAVQVAAPSAAGNVVASQFDIALPTAHRRAFELFCTLLL